MSNLPDGVTDADIDRSQGVGGKCECGHDYDDHADPQDLYENPQTLIDALREIEEITNHPNRTSLGRDYYNEIGKIIDETFAICQAHGCTCRTFWAADPDDDGDYSYDAMVDKRGER